jgi:transketolase
MRNAFVKQLEAEAKLNDRLILLVGDIGFGVFEQFQQEFPNRFINMGIAEQNMISVASGLAKEGFHPVVYTIVPFLTMRAFEQIRIDVCLHSRDILLVGVGGGYAYDVLGPTHHSLEDVSIMRSLPGMEIYTPSAPSHIQYINASIFRKSGPKYLRLGKNGEKEFESNSIFREEMGCFEIGSSDDLVLVSHGPISEQVELARLKIQQEHGILAKHILVAKSEPVSKKLFQEISNLSEVYFIEETYRVGSLYSEFLDFVQGSNIQVRVFGKHAPKSFYHRVANREEILKHIELDALSITNFIVSNYKGGKYESETC